MVLRSACLKIQLAYQRLRGSILKAGRQMLWNLNPYRAHRLNCSEFSVVLAMREYGLPDGE